jgi:hydroxymethylpyrimidine pyrophosphatase-like HAD family hydrolase
MAALEKFVAAGNIFAISTGRGTENAVYVQKNYGLTFPGSYVIAYNGAELYDYSAGKSIYRVGVPLDVTREILQMAAERGVHVHTFNDHYIVGSAYDEEMTFYKRIIKTLIAQGAQGIILGCTEIELLIKQGESMVPLFPTSAIHAIAAVEKALEEA